MNRSEANRVEWNELFVFIVLIDVCFRCWTRGKQDKLEYFKETKMWYVSDECPLSSLVHGGVIYQQLGQADAAILSKLLNKVNQASNSPLHTEIGSFSLIQKCCSKMTGAP